MTKKMILFEAHELWELLYDAAKRGKAIDIAFNEIQVQPGCFIVVATATYPSTEETGREAVVTDKEKAAEQIYQDVMADRIDAAGRKRVRHALDQKDKPPEGRAAQDQALGNAIGRFGGV